MENRYQVQVKTHGAWVDIVRCDTQPQAEEWAKKLEKARDLPARWYNREPQRRAFSTSHQAGHNGGMI